MYQIFMHPTKHAWAALSISDTALKHSDIIKIWDKFLSGTATHVSVIIKVQFVAKLLVVIVMHHCQCLRTYQDILEWQKNHCDVTMVLQSGSCLSLALRWVSEWVSVQVCVCTLNWEPSGIVAQLYDLVWLGAFRYCSPAVWSSLAGSLQVL